jgi:hypothetical protein
VLANHGEAIGFRESYNDVVVLIVRSKALSKLLGKTPFSSKATKIRG